MEESGGRIVTAAFEMVEQYTAYEYRFDGRAVARSDVSAQLSHGLVMLLQALEGRRYLSLRAISLALVVGNVAKVLVAQR
jgi:hypothetical protein